MGYNSEIFWVIFFIKVCAKGSCYQCFICSEFNPNWDFGRSTGQVEQFEDFLFQSSRYPSLLTGDSAKRVVLVEVRVS